MVWAAIVIGTIAIALVFFELQSWRMPLPRGLQDGGTWWSDASLPPGGRGDLKKPHH